MNTERKPEIQQKMMFNFKMCKTGFKQICKHYMYTVYTKIVNINTLTETDRE